MSSSNQGLRRVCVHANAVHVDLSLPAWVQVAALMPSIVDILADHGGHRAVPMDSAPVRFQLFRPDMAALDNSMTLAENGIQNGTLLVLTSAGIELPAPRCDDEAVAVSVAVGTARPWTPRASRLTGAMIAGWLAGVGGVALTRSVFGSTGARHIGTTAGAAAGLGCAAVLAAMIAHRVYRQPIASLTLGLLGVGFAAVAGLVAVPSGPGAPNVLLSAMVAAVASVVTMHLSGCGAVTLTAVSGLAVLSALVALAGLITGAPLQVIGSISAVASLVLLELSARVSIALAGLSPRLPSVLDPGDSVPVPDHLSAKAIRAQGWLTSLTVAFSASTALGVVGAVVGVHTTHGPRFGGFMFATVTGAALLLRARSHTDLVCTVVLLMSGTAAVSAAFVDAAASTAVPTQYLPWICAATVTLTAAALGLAFVTPAMTFSPVARRGAELLAYLVPAAVVPLACWICGVFGAARGLSLI